MPLPPPTQGGYGAYNAYISAATRYAALGAPTLYDHPGPIYGSKHQAPVLTESDLCCIILTSDYPIL